MKLIDKKFIRTLSMLGSCGAYGMACIDIADRYSDFVALTADLCFYSGLDRFKQKFPDRILNVGIAEQNLLGVAGGLSHEGYNVFASTYASFACTRALDQVKSNMGYMKLPIKLVGLTSGFSVGILGTTHMCIEDISIFRSIPNITILSPADSLETYKIILAACDLKVPTYIRLSGTLNNPIVYNEDYNLEIGTPIELASDGEYVIFATGTMVHNAIKVSDELRKQGINIKVTNVHTIKPLDEEKIISIAENCKIVFTLEEHNVLGGLGTAILECLNKNKLNKYVRNIGINDNYSFAGDYNYLLSQNKLDVTNILDVVKEEIMMNNEKLFAVSFASGGGGSY